MTQVPWWLALVPAATLAGTLFGMWGLRGRADLERLTRPRLGDPHNERTARHEHP